ncbi:MAG: N-acetylmuramoyl-L-alanine amidase [Ruminococcus sp.]|nr:N-acetylmuramoyl-L-alanine amidase [Ruminococcus sp.]
MPTVYLSPSLQESNPYVGGGNEEYYMNLVADAMEPYLRASGINFVRNDPQDSLSKTIADSNAGNYDLHLAIHSNASSADRAGNATGVQVYYYPSSSRGERFANVIADNYKGLYYDPSKVTTIPTTSLAEVRRTKAPAVLVETAFHDNPNDAQWIRENIDGIARNLSKSIADYLGVPFVTP